MRQGIVLVLSAPSGTGKSTLSEMLLKEFPNLGYSVSCTTRQARAGEINGVHYHFLCLDDFETKEKMVNCGVGPGSWKFLWHPPLAAEKNVGCRQGCAV